MTIRPHYSKSNVDLSVIGEDTIFVEEEHDKLILALGNSGMFSWDSDDSDEEDDDDW